MIEPSGITVADARDTSTEGLMRALQMLPEHRAKVLRQSEDDRVNPKFDEQLRAEMLSINNNFLRIWDRAEEILRAELKKRLH